MRKAAWKKSHIGKRGVALAVVFCILFGLFVSPGAAEAKKQKDQLLTLSAAKRLAIANSEKIEGLEVQIMTKEASVASATRALKERERDMGTFRWSPLLSFKFPTKPNESEAFEFQFKPTQLNNQKKILQHKMTDAESEISEKVSKTYIDIISADQALAYDNLRVRKLSASLDKIKLRREEGSATAKQVETAQKRYDAATGAKLKDETKLIRAKQKMKTLTGLDVTTGYRFQKSFVTAEMSRDDIPYLQSTALAGDQNIFELQMEEEEANLALQVNYNLIRSKYSGYISRISSYIEAAKSGSKISKKAFKADYDKFLKEIDEPWQGSYRILFISFPKEWLKGSLDGIRYVQDDPQVLYTAALDYESARKALSSGKEDLKNTVYELYDNYVETKKAYEDAKKEYYTQRSQITVDEVKNLMGALSDEEYETEYQEFEDSKSTMDEALATYSEALFEFDRTTCGGVSTFFDGDSKGSGVSLMPVVQQGMSYRFKPVADSEEFLLYINVPDDFNAKTGLNVTHFQLRCNGKNIGSKTAVGRGMRHLALSAENVVEAFIRIYDGDTILDDCPIDPAVAAGPLSLTTGFEAPKKLRVIGTYTTTPKLETDTVEIRVEFDQGQVQKEYVSGEAAASYTLATDAGSVLGSGEKTKADDAFKYLGLIQGDIEKLILHMYDGAGQEIGTAKFNTATKQIYHDIDDVEAERIAEEKARIAAEDAKTAAAEEEQERENAAETEAKLLLEKLGMEPTPENIAYARTHGKELAYAVELKGNAEDLDKNAEQVKQQIEKAKAAGEDTSALEKRLETIGKQKAVVEKSLGGMESYQNFVGGDAQKQQEIIRLKNAVTAARKYISEGKDTLKRQVESLTAKETSLKNQLKNKKTAVRKKQIEASTEQEKKDIEEESREDIEKLNTQIDAVAKAKALKKAELDQYDSTAAAKRSEITEALQKLKALGADTSGYE